MVTLCDLATWMNLFSCTLSVYVICRPIYILVGNDFVKFEDPL